MPAGLAHRAPPDFVGIGAYRSGTTWLYEMIVAHPDVAIPPGRPKELDFFEPFWEVGFTPAEVSRYHRYFPRPPGKLVGEWTPALHVRQLDPPDAGRSRAVRRGSS